MVPELPTTWLSPVILCAVNLRLKPHKAFAHCQYEIQQLLARGPHRWKIGLTTCPVDRWFAIGNDKYFRCYDQMLLLHACTSLEAGYILEACLIDKYWNTPGLDNKKRNDRGGGGQPKSDSKLVYIYVVSLRADLRDAAMIALIESRVDLRWALWRPDEFSIGR